MATLILRAHGAAPVTLAWERYADPALWSTWAPQIQRVDTGLQRLEVGGTGTVRAGLLHRPTLGVPFRVLAVDEEAREADLGVASGNGKGQIFVKGEVIKTVPESQIVETLIEEAMRIAEGMEPLDGEAAGTGGATVTVS